MQVLSSEAKVVYLALQATAGDELTLCLGSAAAELQRT